MITDPDAVTVLCYGDSNTYGQRAEEVDKGRWPADVRWTGQLQRLLGDGYYVIEEGLGGRTTDVDYPEVAARPGRNGRTYLVPCLYTHGPLDVVVLMLGTNDVKVLFDRSPEQITAGLAGLLDDIAEHGWNRDDQPPRVVLLSPAHVDPAAPMFAEVNGASYDSGSAAKSRQLAGPAAALATERGVLFADAASVAQAGGDGVHLSLGSHSALAGLVADKIAEALR